MPDRCTAPFPGLAHGGAFQGHDLVGCPIQTPKFNPHRSLAIRVLDRWLNAPDRWFRYSAVGFNRRPLTPRAAAAVTLPSAPLLLCSSAHSTERSEMAYSSSE